MSPKEHRRPTLSHSVIACSAGQTTGIDAARAVPYAMPYAQRAAPRYERELSRFSRAIRFHGWCHRLCMLGGLLFCSATEGTFSVFISSNYTLAVNVGTCFE